MSLDQWTIQNQCCWLRIEDPFNQKRCSQTCCWTCQTSSCSSPWEEEERSWKKRSFRIETLMSTWMNCLTNLSRWTLRWSMKKTGISPPLVSRSKFTLSSSNFHTHARCWQKLRHSSTQHSFVLSSEYMKFPISPLSMYSCPPTRWPTFQMVSRIFYVISTKPTFVLSWIDPEHPARNPRRTRQSRGDEEIRTKESCGSRQRR